MRMGMSGISIVVVLLIVAIVIALIVVAVAVVLPIALGTRNKNKNMPQVTAGAVVIGRRETASGYFVAFQLDSGERIELNVDTNAYGMLVDGERGMVTFQGTRCLGFQRTN